MLKNNFPPLSSEPYKVKEYVTETILVNDRPQSRVYSKFTDFSDGVFLNVNQVPTLIESKISGQNLKQAIIKLFPDLESSDRLNEEYVNNNINNLPEPTQQENNE